MTSVVKKIMGIKYRNILFVCTGNTCRSPMAEALLKKMIEEKFPDLHDGIKISSAGAAAINDAPPTYEAYDVMKKRSIDIDGHKARLVNREIINEADIIFAMTQRHYDELISRFPESKGKIFILKEYADAGIMEKNVADPIGEPEEVYENCARTIEESLEKIIERWTKL